MEPRLQAILDEVRAARGKVLALTGAGISAESGIPTFRGAEGYWVVGSRNYMPQEMATREMFDRRPDEVWRWYLYRFGVCRGAQPNAGQPKLVQLQVVYDELPEQMVTGVEPLLKAGVAILGACCGSTPDHIRAFRKAMDAYETQAV